MKNYHHMVRPVANDSDSLTVEFGVTLNQIVDVVRKPSALNTFLLSDTVLHNFQTL